MITLDQNIFYLVVALVAVQFIIILILAVKRKSPARDIAAPAAGDDEEIKNLKYLYGRLKSESESNKKRIGHLESQIKDMQVYIGQLEQGNVQLMEQKEMLLESKQKLEALQKQKDQYFAMAVHDIKNPAGAIRGLLELLEDYDINAVEQQEIMGSLVKSSEQIVKLVQAISESIAATKEDAFLKIEDANVKTLIDEVTSSNLAYAKKKDVKLVNKTSMHTPEVKIDVGKIEEVIDNLVNNAIKFAPPGTLVQVRTFFNDSMVAVEVTDDGVGIPEEQLNKAFKKGATLGPKPTGNEKSSGLGLWAVKSIVEEHGGEVKVKSKVGVGSTFTITLPRS